MSSGDNGLQRFFARQSNGFVTSEERSCCGCGFCGRSHIASRVGEEIANKDVMPGKSAKLPKCCEAEGISFSKLPIPQRLKSFLRLVDHTKIDHAVYEILYREGYQQQTHNADQNPDAWYLPRARATRSEFPRIR